MSAQEILAELAGLGNEATKKTLMRHGAREPFFGVKVEDMKKIVKRVKKNHELALELYRTGNSDAMYLAGLIADEKKMTPADLQSWAEGASWQMISESTVAWIAAESPHGEAMARAWIESDRESIASAGWSTWSNLVAVRPDERLDLQELERLLERVENKVQGAANRVRYTMNGFVISVGCYVAGLTEKARQVATRLGKVRVDVGETACKVPDAIAYIDKVEKMGRIGKKRKQARC